MSNRRLARQAVVSPLFVGSDDPKRVTQQLLESPRGSVRAWFKAGACYRVLVAGVVYGRGEGPAVWAAVLDGTFRPNDFGKHLR